MTDSIFTKILKHEIPGIIIHEDEHSFVIPDKFPSMHGQLLVITKRQVPYIFDLSDDEYQGIMQTARTMARALDRALATERTCVVVEGFEVPHVHIRLYPCPTADLVWSPRFEATNEELAELAEKVKNALT